MHVEYLGRGYLAAFGVDALNQVGMLSQMLYGLHGDLLGKSDRHNFLHILDSTSWITQEVINMDESVLDRLDP